MNFNNLLRWYVPMKLVNNETDHQIRLLGFQALRRELGIMGFVRFMQQFDTDTGDYVKDRQEWQKELASFRTSAKLPDLQASIRTITSLPVFF